MACALLKKYSFESVGLVQTSLSIVVQSLSDSLRLPGRIIANTAAN